MDLVSDSPEALESRRVFTDDGVKTCHNHCEGNIQNPSCLLQLVADLLLDFLRARTGRFDAMEMQEKCSHNST